MQAADIILEEAVALAATTDWNDQGAIDHLEERLREQASRLSARPRLSVWDAQGGLRFSTSNLAHPDMRAEHRSYFTAHKSGNIGLFFSELFIGQSGKRPIFVLSRRIDGPAGEFAGVVAVAVDMELLAESYNGIKSRHDRSVLWLREDGQPLMRDPMEYLEKMVGQPPSPASEWVVTQQQREGHATWRSIYDGKLRTLVYRKSNEFPLYVLVSVSEMAVAAAWAKSILPLVLFGLACIASLLWLRHYALRWAKREEGYLALLAGMNDSLQSSNNELEQRVARRTRDLEEQSTALLRALSEKDSLLREVNHRIKNSLQLVCSLLTLQGYKSQEPGVRHQLAEAVSRVSAIARMHERLYLTDKIKEVDLPEYLGGLLTDLERSTGDGALWQVRFSPVPARLSPDQAVPLALLVNELVTNAFKYGRPIDGSEWLVQVVMSRPEPGKLQLEVFDPGPGLPDPDLLHKGGNLGMQLVRSLTRQINGTVTIGEGPSFSLRIILPCPEAEAPADAEKADA
ncbi:sensor histidine kinase [Telmatospirillum sp. J64-1]|uniref:sensor histidine kinase n=1 Tax=Telmatospirillum sp. J64-1 TaxID=2502183 RepID=UPI00163DCCC7|nr:histidine kinase dimerization/phosphoacceptor domain -containing protein [Telmatospirillum sp. J64-1]